MRFPALFGVVIGLTACAAPAATSSPADATAAAASATALPAPVSATPSATPASTPVTTPDPAAWRQLTTASGPSAREDHTWTVDETGGTAYLFGGRDGATVFEDVWAFDLASDSWSELDVEPGPPARFGHEAAWVEGIGLVVFAGQSGPTTFFSDLWAFDPAAASWRQLPSGGDVPVARYGTCAAIGPDGRLWISHGFTQDQTRFSDTVAYDFAAGTWEAETPDSALPIPRCLHGCWWTDAGELALYAGQTTGVTALGDLWLLADGGWTAVSGSLPAARNLYARARLDGGTLVFGGQAVDATYLADLFVIADTGAIVPVSPAGEAPGPRAGAEMVLDADGGRVLLFGGKDAEGALDDVWELTGGPLAR